MLRLFRAMVYLNTMFFAPTTLYPPPARGARYWLPLRLVFVEPAGALLSVRFFPFLLVTVYYGG